MIRYSLRNFFSLLIIFCGKYGFSQPVFQNLYGGVNQEISLVALPCPSGGIYYLGATTSTGSGDADPVLMKLDDNGQVVWARAIGGVNYDVAGAMTLASDGGLVCAGSTKSFNGNTADDLYFFKTDSLGGMQWSKTFSTSGFDVASAIIRTSDNGFAIAGFTYVSGLKKVLLIRTDSNGDTLFTRIYGGVSDDQGVELCQTSDGGFLITGKTFTQSLGESDIMLMRTDSFGDLLWAKSFGGIHWDEGAGIMHLQDGNYLLSGSTISFGQGDFDILLMKTDTSGNILWGKTYGGTKTDAAYTSRENADGSIVTSGYSNSMGYGHSLRMGNLAEVESGDRGDDSTNIFLMKVDAVGDTIWTRSYGDGAQDEAFHFAKMDNGDYIIPGFTTSYTNFTDSTQMLLIRTDSMGHSGCHEQDSRPIIDTTNFITQTLAFTQSGGITENTVVSNDLAWNISAEDACLFIKVEGNLSDDANVLVFPNPASNLLSVSCMQLAINSIAIYNLLGEKVSVVNLPIANCPLQTLIDVSFLQSGIYFLKLTSTSTNITKKIIIQKN
ncbi:MAG: T9SS type A sorting domain-containing protein [Bacteroidota bacterium]